MGYTDYTNNYRDENKRKSEDTLKSIGYEPEGGYSSLWRPKNSTLGPAMWIDPVTGETYSE